MAKFLGVYKALSAITVSPQNGDTVILNSSSNSKLYYYDNNNWEEATYLGTYISSYSGNAPNNYSVISIVPSGKPKYPFSAEFKIYKNNAWETISPIAQLNILEVN